MSVWKDIHFRLDIEDPQQARIYAVIQAQGRRKGKSFICRCIESADESVLQDEQSQSILNDILHRLDILEQRTGSEPQAQKQELHPVRDEVPEIGDDILSFVQGLRADPESSVPIV